MNRRVVVTGIGLVSALGIGTSETWAALLAGQSGVTRITKFDISGYATQIAAEVKGFDPLAFIENQAGAHNIHDDLTPESSARIIAGHVRDGIDLGYEYGLPVQIIGFIPQHHGTSVMSYFYGKALRELGGDEEVAARDSYRYPGPKPQSR